MSKRNYIPTRRGYLRHHWKAVRRQRRTWTDKRNIGTEWDTRGVNDRIGIELGPDGHRAIEEIRLGLVLAGAQKVAQMLSPDHIPATGDDWSKELKDLWDRFHRWDRTLRAEDWKTHKAVILFAKGHKPTVIDAEVRIRKGTCIARIVKGAAAYVALLDGKRRQPRTLAKKKPGPVTRPDFKISKIVQFED